MNIKEGMKRALAFVLVLLMTYSDCFAMHAMAAETEQSGSQHTGVEGLPGTVELTGENTLNIGFSEEAEAGLVSAMDALAELMQNGQVTYDETANMLVLTDPNADISGLSFDDIAIVPAEEEIAEEEIAEEEIAEEEIAEEETVEEETVEEETAEEETAEEETAEEVPLATDEAELMLFSNDCDKHVATKEKKVPYYDTYKDGRKKKGTISAKGTLLKVVDEKWSGLWLFSDKYYKVKEEKSGAVGWVKANKVNKHDCTESSPAKKTTYKAISKNGLFHTKIVKTDAVKCKVCGCKLKNADESKSWEFHDWDGVGICKKTGCKYDYSEEIVSIDNVRYVVKESEVKLRTTPYDAAASTRTLAKGDTVIVKNRAKNTKTEFWFCTTAGDWVKNTCVEKHTSHSYSSDTGLCKCGAKYKYDIKAMSSEAYEIKGSSKVELKKTPYEKGTVSGYLNSGEVLYFNSYTYSDPNPRWFGLDKGPKWYQAENGGWVKAEHVKLHQTHKYSAVSEGRCTFTNCKEEMALKPSWLQTSREAVSYETVKSNVVGRTKPYSTAQVKETYTRTGQTVRIDQLVKNAQKETWYRTADGYWIPKNDLKFHTHNMSLGSCTNAGCGYVAKLKTSAFSTPKPYEITTATQLKAKPFTDAANAGYLATDTCVMINAICTVEGEKWYRTTTGGYLAVSCAKEHKHDYVGGYCAACDTYKNWTTTTINPAIVKAKAEVAVREKPYEVAKEIRTLKKDETIVIVQQCKNAFKNVWYQLMDGSWIYSGNVKTSNGGTVKTSSKKTVDKYNLTLVDSSNNPISGATVEWVGETYTSDEKGKVQLAYVTDKTDIVIKKNDYDTVTLSGYKMNSNRKDTITMAVAGSYKATKVTMNYMGEDTNLLRTAKTLNQYHTQMFFRDAPIKIACEVSASVQPDHYALVQGKSNVAVSFDGTFEDLTVQSFTANKTVYLVIYDARGQERARQKLLLDIFNERLDGTTPSFDLGLGKLAFTIPSKVPLIGGMNIEIDPGGVIDVSVNVDDESTKVSLNVDATDFAKNVSKKTPPKDKENWHSFQGYKEYWDALKEINEKGWTKYSEAKIKKEKASKPKWSFEFGGYVEKMHGEDIWHGKLCFAVLCKFSEESPFTCPPGIPMVIELSLVGKAAVSGEVTLIDAKITDFSIPLDVSVSVEGSVGVGVKYVASISIFGKLTLGLHVQMIPYDWDETNLHLSGNLGIKAKVLGAEIARWNALQTKVLYIIEDGKICLFDEEELESYLLNAGSYQPIDRSYLNNRSGWYGEGVSLLEEDISVLISDLDVEVLQSSTYTDLKPQVVAASDGTIMMLFTDDNAARADIDRTMLVYSLYDPALKQWTQPKAVKDDNTADYGFSVHTVDGDIYVVWQNAKRLHSADADISAISKDTEVTIAKYDAALDCFDHVQQITDNEQFENMPRVSSVNGQVVVSWLTNSADDVFQQAGENTVWYAVKNDADYDTTEPYGEIDLSEEEEPIEGEEETSAEGEEETPAEGENTPAEGEEETETIVPDEEYVEPIPEPWTISSLAPISDAVTSMAVGYMLDKGYVAFTTDADGNTATHDDQYIHLLDAQSGELMQYTDKACNVEFTQVHGYNAMTWYNQGRIYYSYTSEDAPQLLFEEATNMENGYQLIADQNGNMAILFTQNEENSSEAYLMMYDIENLEWGYPVAVTDQDLYVRDFYGAYTDGMIVSIFNRTAINQETQEEDNTLCTAIINERVDLKISEVDVNTYDLKPLEPTPVRLTVTNGGTRRVEKFTVTLYDSEDVVIQSQVVEQTLKMGQSMEIELNLTMPENITLSTYRLAVTEEGEEDVFPEDNEQRFILGEPHLVVTASSEPTDTENIVVLTVTNKGYGAQAGSLVRLTGNDDVEEVLVEQFQAIEHDGEYSCAVLFDEYYFDGEPGMTFRFGVIPEGETAVSHAVSLYVDRVQSADDADIIIGDSDLEDEDDEAVLQESQEKTVSGELRNYSDEDIQDAILSVVAYDRSGFYLDTYTQEVATLASEETLSFTARFSAELEISTIRILLQDKESMEPLIDVSDMELVYDTVMD